jgi:ribosomal protein L5
MSFFLQNNQKRIQFTRAFYYKNLHEVPFTIETITLSYTTFIETSLKSIIKISALLELITEKRPILLRSEKLSTFSKVRKGAPMGSAVLLRKKSLQKFYFFILYEIFPNFKHKAMKAKLSSLRSSFSFLIPDPLIFPRIHKFYIFLKNYVNLRCNISFTKKSSNVEIIFHKRLMLFPF